MNTKKTLAENLNVGDRFIDDLERLNEIIDVNPSPYGPSSIAITFKKVEEDTEYTEFSWTKTRYAHIDDIYNTVV